MRRILMIWIVLASSASSTVVVAQEHVREGGLIRMATGLGGPLDESGETGSFDSLALGWAVAPGFVVQLELWGDSATAYGVGPGITYYLMPLNLYWSTSYGFSGSYEDASVTGWSAAHMIGKEWWVSDNWALGVAGQFIYSDLDVSALEDVETFSLGVLFSSTYN